MANFQVDRTQYPIGQGGFHSMALHTPRKRCFSMVVDCGGSRAEHRKLLAEAFAERERQHDFLAISHLDDDHINGLEDLKDAGVSFKTVFLPHVDMSSYLQWMTLKLSASSSAERVLPKFAEVATLLYGGHFGPIVLVGNPADGDDEGSEPVPIEDEHDNSVLSDDARQAIARAKRAKGTGFSCSTSLRFDLDWLIRFYSREWKLPKEIASIWSLDLLDGLQNVISSITANFTSSNWKKFAVNLKSELRKTVDSSLSTEPASLVPETDPRTPDLKKLGVEIATGKMSCKKLLSKMYKIFTSLNDYNDASMCVYSGPAERGIGVPRNNFLHWVHTSGLSANLLSNTSRRAVGWIHTGDANFTGQSRLQDFLNHYITEVSLTSVLVLPHHGSRLSFDRNMDHLRGLAARLAKPTVFVAPSDPLGKYHHPDGDVVHACHRLGDLAIVSEDAASYYSDSATNGFNWVPYWRA